MLNLSLNEILLEFLVNCLAFCRTSTPEPGSKPGKHVTITVRETKTERMRSQSPPGGEKPNHFIDIIKQKLLMID